MGSHGVHGLSKILPLTEFPERFENLKKAHLFRENESLFKLEVENIRFTGTNILIKFKSFSTPEEVNKYKGCLIKVPKSERFSLPEDNYYLDDLVGLKAISDDGIDIGVVTGTYSSGNIILEITTSDRKEENSSM